LEVSNESFNIVDLKPPNLEELTEVITTACMHPTNCNILMYSSSRGNIRLADMREAALCDQNSKLFEIEEQPGSKSFFTEIISSISDAKFTQDGSFPLLLLLLPTTTTATSLFLALIIIFNSFL